MKYFLITLVTFSGMLLANSAQAGVAIGSYNFDLDQFVGATVTYRPDSDGGMVSFDGKLWDNHVGVSSFTTAELAAGQFGSDPGDQLSLNNRVTPDWFQLNYGGGGIMIGGPDSDTFVIYEITSSNAGVDTEGTSWEISFNGGAFINANSGTATFLDFSADGVENVNQIAFDLTDFGFNSGDMLTTVRVQNIDSGSGTSDPDFIFTALESPAAVPEASSVVAWACFAIGGLVCVWRRKASLLERASLPQAV